MTTITSPTTTQPSLRLPRAVGSDRVSDADRERTVNTLRAATAAGALEIAELEERLERTWQARTYAELSAVTADLGTWLTHRSRSARQLASARSAHAAMRRAGIAVAVAIAVMALIWLLTGAVAGWLIWPVAGAAPWLIAPSRGPRHHTQRHLRFTA